MTIRNSSQGPTGSDGTQIQRLALLASMSAGGVSDRVLLALMSAMIAAGNEANPDIPDEKTEPEPMADRAVAIAEAVLTRIDKFPAPAPALAPAPEVTRDLAADSARLDWLDANPDRLEDVRGRINNEGVNVRDAIDWFAWLHTGV